MKPHMTDTSLNRVIVPANRIRAEFDPDRINSLAFSIWKLGQLQPIVLADDGETLISGERRLRAFRLLFDTLSNLDTPEVESFKALLDREDYPTPHPQIASFYDRGAIGAVLRSDLSPRAKLEAELEENTHRVDLTWQEQAKAKAQLHKFRTEQAAESGKTWSLKDTAEEIAGREPTSSDRAKVSEALALDEFLDDPLVAAAPSEREALKIIRNMNKERARAAAADNFDPTKSPHKCSNMDAYEWLASLIPESADCLLWDPPYGRNMQVHGFARKHEYDDTPEALTKAINEGPALIAAALKPQAHGYIFCDLRSWQHWTTELAVHGLDPWPLPLIWDKGTIGTYGNHELGPRHCYDAIIYFNKGARPTTALYRDVIPINQEQDLEHPAGKPVPLLVDLLHRTVSPGDIVIDPMCGGGTFFLACTQLKVTGWGNEGVEKWYHMCLEKLTHKGVAARASA